MKKTLKLLFTLTTTASVPLSVVACGQEDLDLILNTVYHGDTKFNLEDLISYESKDVPKTISLNQEQTNELAKKIVEKDLAKKEIETKITWYDKNTEVNKKCYNFNITNGKKEESNTVWDVNKINGRFKINISYQVGISNSSKEFEAQQNINMSFEIKCGITDDDKFVNEWTDKFNQQKWDINKPIQIDLTKEKIDIPANNTNWSDLNAKVISTTYTDIDDQITWGRQTVTWVIKNVNDTIKDRKLKLRLEVSLGDSLKNSDDFYIEFK